MNSSEHPANVVLFSDRNIFSISREFMQPAGSFSSTAFESKLVNKHFKKKEKMPIP